MMLQIDHRESHDVDIFMSDPQILSFLNPANHDFAFEVRPHDYAGDGSSFLKLAFEGGEIDFIVGHAMTDDPTKEVDLNNRTVNLETVSEIICKKIYYRGSMIKPRDIFDIAAAAETHGPEIIKALSDYKKETEAALICIDRLNTQFVEASIQQLMLRDAFKGLVPSAIERAKAVLTAV